MGGEKTRDPVLLYGPNGEVISAVNPLPVTFAGEPTVKLKEPVKVEVTNEPAVKAEPGASPLQVDVANTPSVKAEPGASPLSVDVANTPSVKAEPGTSPLQVDVANTPITTKVEGSAGNIAKVNAEGKLEVNGVGSIGEVQGNKSAGEAVGKPLAVGGVDGKGNVRNGLSDENGGRVVIPFSTVHAPFLKNSKQTKANELLTLAIAAVAEYRCVITQLVAGYVALEETTENLLGEVGIKGSAASFFYVTIPTKSPVNTVFTAVNLAGNPIVIAEAVDIEVAVTVLAKAKCVGYASISGYFVKG